MDTRPPFVSGRFPGADSPLARWLKRAQPSITRARYANKRTL